MIVYCSGLYYKPAFIIQNKSGLVEKRWKGKDLAVQLYINHVSDLVLFHIQMLKRQNHRLNIICGKELQPLIEMNKKKNRTIDDRMTHKKRKSNVHPCGPNVACS